MRTLVNEIRQLQKIAGLLKEDDIDLSDTPKFANLKSKLITFVKLLYPEAINDELILKSISHVVETNDVNDLLIIMADVLGDGSDDPDAFDGVFSRSDIESAVDQADLPDEIANDIVNSHYVTRLELGEDLDLSDTPDFKSRPRTVEEFLEEEDFINWLIDSIHENLDWENTQDLIYNYIIKNKTLEDFQDAWKGYQEELAGY